MGQETKNFLNYPFVASRKRVWQEIANYIFSDIGFVDRFLEVGSGYCDFINSYPAKEKICFELNPDRKIYAIPEVDFRCGDAIKLIKNIGLKVNVVFASNFLEHLTSAQLQEFMPEIHNLLVKDGRLILIQPNYRLCSKNYFDDETHQTIFSDRNIVPFLQDYDFDILKLIPGLLPFSMKSRFPKWPVLVRLYLRSPFRPKAAQMYVIAKKR